MAKTDIERLLTGKPPAHHRCAVCSSAAEFNELIETFRKMKAAGKTAWTTAAFYNEILAPKNPPFSLDVLWTHMRNHGDRGSS